MSDPKNHPWYASLNRHMRDNLPKTVSAMSKTEYEDFLTSQVEEARESLATEILKGADPLLAKLMILRELYPQSESDLKEITEKETGDTQTESSLVEV